jgi:hypothetical protein
VVSSTPQSEQLRIEDKALQYAGRPFDPRKTPADVFGSMEDWSYNLGPYRLMLNPFNGEWLYWDDVHGTLEGTGWKAGEGIFELEEDDEVKVRQNGREKLQHGPAEPSADQQRFAALQERYDELQRQHSALEIDRDEFVAAVHELRFQSEDGTWWQLRPEDGAWLLWDGKAWIEAEQPLDWL